MAYTQQSSTKAARWNAWKLERTNCGTKSGGTGRYAKNISSINCPGASRDYHCTDDYQLACATAAETAKWAAHGVFNR